jgi:hypothetical protein
MRISAPCRDFVASRAALARLPLKPVFGVRDFALKGHDALVLIFGFHGTLSLQGAQHHCEAFRIKQPLDKTIGDKAVQPVHSD